MRPQRSEATTGVSGLHPSVNSRSSLGEWPLWTSQRTWISRTGNPRRLGMTQQRGADTWRKPSQKEEAGQKCTPRCWRSRECICPLQRAPGQDEGKWRGTGRKSPPVSMWHEQNLDQGFRNVSKQEGPWDWAVEQKKTKRSRVCNHWRSSLLNAGIPKVSVPLQGSAGLKQRDLLTNIHSYVSGIFNVGTLSL